MKIDKIINFVSLKKKQDENTEGVPISLKNISKRNVKTLI